jgi:hypothetical protein
VAITAPTATSQARSGSAVSTLKASRKSPRFTAAEAMTASAVACPPRATAVANGKEREQAVVGHQRRLAARLVVAELPCHRPRDGEHGVPLLEAVSAADLPLDPADLPQFARNRPRRCQR